jgi:hypothetical protein
MITRICTLILIFFTARTVAADLPPGHESDELC